MSHNKQDKGFRFSIRKRSVGVCGVAIATFFTRFWTNFFNQM